MCVPSIPAETRSAFIATEQELSLERARLAGGAAMTTKSLIAAFVFAAMIVLVRAPASAQPAGADCRTVKIDGVSQTMCRDKAGEWRSQRQDLPSGGLPDGFRGRISYRGNYQGQVTTPGPPMRRLSIADALRAAGRTTQFAGGYEAELDIAGNAVTGRYSGSGGIDTVTFSGTRTGDHCRLFLDRTGASIDAQCTASRFDGTVKSSPTERRPSTIHFDAAATQVVDAAVEERQRQSQVAAASAERQRVAAEAAAKSAAEAAALRSRPAARPALRQLLERAIVQDATNWPYNRYDVGSLTGVVVLDTEGGATRLH